MMEDMNGLPVVAHYVKVRDMGSEEKFGRRRQVRIADRRRVSGDCRTLCRDQTLRELKFEGK